MERLKTLVILLILFSLVFLVAGSGDVEIREGVQINQPDRNTDINISQDFNLGGLKAYTGTTTFEGSNFTVKPSTADNVLVKLDFYNLSDELGSYTANFSANTTASNNVNFTFNNLYTSKGYKAFQNQTLKKHAKADSGIFFFDNSIWNGKEYQNFTLNYTTPPNAEPVPNITNIKIFDVTGLSDQEKETGGILVGEGLNETFILNQQEDEREYRFEFVIRNDGSRDWSLENTDELFHEGLNTGWTVHEIWYNLSKSYTGGSFSSGKVSWDTSNGGLLEWEDNNDTMYAKYRANISETSEVTYDEHFVVNDTSEESGTEDFHELSIKKRILLEMDLLDPPNSTVVRRNDTFLVNASITCRGGDCNQVDGSTRYNKSNTADTLIPENPSEPFHTNNSNTKKCGDLLKDETCYISWNVNATGERRSYHWIDVNASASTGDTNDTADHQVQINRIVLMDTTWDYTNFGVLDPGSQNNSAEGNDNLEYNVSVSEASLPVDDLWIKTDDMQSEQLDYTIGASNLSYSLTKDISTEKRLSGEYQNVKSNIDPGTNVTTFYWIDVPTGIYKGIYQGTLYFKANSTW